MIIERLPPRSSRRSGGREARRALRAAPLAEDVKPVRAGLSGGQFRPLDDAAVVASLKAAADVQVHQLWHQLADNTPYSPDAGPGAALGWSQARRSGALLTAFESSLSPAMTCTRRCPHRSPQPSRTPGPEHYMYTDTERPSLAAPAAVTSRSVVLAAVSGSSSARGPISPRGRLETLST